MIFLLMTFVALAQELPDISGTWLLDRRENLKNYLISRGEENPVKHSAIKCIKPQMEIKQNNINFSIETTLKPCIPLAPNKTISRDFIADGKTQNKGKILDGEEVTWTAWFKNNELVVKVNTTLGTEYVTRHLDNDELVQKNWLEDKNVVLIQHFKRVK